MSKERKLQTFEYTSRPMSVGKCSGEETLTGATGLFLYIDPKFEELGLAYSESGDEIESMYCLYPEIHPKNGVYAKLFVTAEQQSEEKYKWRNRNALHPEYITFTGIAYYGVGIIYFCDHQIKTLIENIKETRPYLLGAGNALVFIMKKKGKFFVISVLSEKSGLGLYVNKYKGCHSVKKPADSENCYFIQRQPCSFEVLEAHDM